MFLFRSEAQQSCIWTAMTYMWSVCGHSYMSISFIFNVSTLLFMRSFIIYLIFIIYESPSICKENVMIGWAHLRRSVKKGLALLDLTFSLWVISLIKLSDGSKLEVTVIVWKACLGALPSAPPRCIPVTSSQHVTAETVNIIRWSNSSLSSSASDAHRLRLAFLSIPLKTLLTFRTSCSE